MSAFHDSALIGASGQGAYQIERSLRFNSADSSYLSRTPASAGNRKTWTWAGWVKRSALGANQTLFEAGNGSIYTLIWFNSSDKIGILEDRGSGGVYFPSTAAVFRDTSAWYHIVVAVDTTQSTSTNRIKIYVNGVQQTIDNSYPSQNDDTYINSTNAHRIGYRVGNSSAISAYLADIHFIDGQALAPTSFGFFDANGIWQPKAYEGAYGTNGFHLPLNNNSTAAALGTDTSGNGNTWTVNNISVAAGAGNDSLVDSPTNYGEDSGLGGEVRGNYCTLNPLKNEMVLSNGNLTATNSASTYSTVLGTIGVSTGKWYWEVLATTASGASIGLGSANTNPGTYLGAGTDFGYGPIGNIYGPGDTITQSGLATYANGDVIGVALDLDLSEVKFYKNNSLVATVTNLAAITWFPAVSDSTSLASNPTLECNFGQRPFAYPAPSGFKALTTANLPAPTIADGSTAMDVVTYTGNGTTQTISGLEFSPDLVWAKVRNTTGNHSLYDIVRGTTKRLSSSTTSAEATFTSSLTSFDSGGFSLGSNPDGDVNASGNTYVAWTWDAGSSTVTNNDGSITSQVRANPSAGFSIVTYTGTGSTATVGHGLGVKPSMIINKVRSAGTSNDNWFVYHSSNFGGDPAWQRALLLNSTGTGGSSNTYPWGADHTSAIMAVNGSVPTWSTNTSGATYVAYCFAPVESYSAFGKYTGNGSADGPFVYTGFRPRFIMYKYSSAAGSWAILDSQRDSENVADQYLLANLSDAEGTLALIDFTSNGFKIRTNSAGTNASGGTYIYAAFAENPFALARAR